VSSQQRAFLLHQLAHAPGGKLSQSDANSAIPAQFKKELKLSAKAANALRHEMVGTGWIVEEKSGRNVLCSVTEAGRQHLRQLDRYIPLLPAKGAVNLPADDRVRVTREVYVLDALARAAGRTISKANLEVGFGGKPKLKIAELAAKHPDVTAFRDQHCLALNPATTRTVLSELALRGVISVNRLADSESYSLTTAGSEMLDKLRSECPVLPPTGGKPIPAPNESVRRGREAFLLLKLLEAPTHTATAAAAQDVKYPKPFKLNHATAWQLRNELARDGFVALRWDGKQGNYTLKPTGKRYLATLSFDTFGEFKIKGSTLTALLAAAREVTPSVAGDVPRSVEPQKPQVAPTTAQLEAAVMDIFQELLRGRFANLRMVPIHEIRSEVARRFGQHSVSHADFNDRLLDLRRTEKVRLISIDDRSRATSEQLRDSVFAVGETFFYMEQPDALAQSG
jgi:predicted transcriptional regulator